MTDATEVAQLTFAADCPLCGVKVTGYGPAPEPIVWSSEASLPPLRQVQLELRPCGCRVRSGSLKLLADSNGVVFRIEGESP